MTTTELTTREQLLQALATFDEASQAAEVAAAAFAESKRRVDSNEAERKKAQQDTSPAIYAEWIEQYCVDEATKIEAAAHLERVEKNLNVLRELLNHETAQIERGTAELQDTISQRYAMLARQNSALVDTRARYTAKPTNGGNESDLPFGE